MKKKVLLDYIKFVGVFALFVSHVCSMERAGVDPSPINSQLSFETFPEEIQKEIIGHIIKEDGNNLSLVCRGFKKISDEVTLHLCLSPMIFHSQKFEDYLDFEETKEEKEQEIFKNQFLGRFSNLTSLNLNYNELISDSNLSLLTQLQRLNLKYSRIMDGGLFGLTNLTELSLRGNEFITDASLSELTNLTSLNLCGNEFITDASLSELTNLTKLNLRANERITDKGISLLTNITSLDLRDNGNITAEGLLLLTKLTNLEKDVSYNSDYDWSEYDYEQDCQYDYDDDYDSYDDRGLINWGNSYF